jgi:pimeloyl-ACP methyl ester carboxylesterase
MIPYDHTMITTNGVRLHVVQAGPPEGKLMLMLHGFPEFWYGWRRQIDHFAARGWRVMAPDQRGYNISEKPPGIAAYTRDKLAADVIGLIDAAGVERCTLVAHDWGAVVGWWAAMEYPERIEKLVILNVPHPVVSDRTIGKDWEQTLKSWYIFAFQIPWLPEAAASIGNFDTAVRAIQGAMRPGTFSEDEWAEYRRAWAQPGAFSAMLNWYRAAGQIRTPLPKDRYLKMPTRIIWGAQDIALIREGAEMSMEFVPTGDLIFIEEAGHFVQHEEPERVNHLIEAFVG